VVHATSSHQAGAPARGVWGEGGEGGSSK